MIRLFSTFIVSMLLISVPSLAPAQVPGPALAEARVRLVCGGGTVVTAEYLPGGLLKATCSRNAPKSRAPDALQGTGLTPPVTAGVIFTAVIIAILTGGSGPATTTSLGD